MTVTGSTASRTADASWRTWTLIGLASIWIGVLAVSVVAPDLVSGSEHEHLPLAAFVSWIWGLLATIGYLWGMSTLRGDATLRSAWMGLTVVVAILWVAAVVLGAVMPVWETGSDPTQLPVWALFAPLAAALLTVLASVVAGIFGRTPQEPVA
jgi:hypothetical protein